MAQELPEFSESVVLPPGIKANLTPGFSVIELHTIRCGWAVGRLLVLLAVCVVWLALAGFFYFAALQPGEKVDCLIFGTLFSVLCVVTVIASIAALGSERITVTADEMMLSKRIGFLTWSKRLKRESVTAVSMGRLATPGEDVSSIDVISLIYRTKSTRGWNRFIVGYLLDARYRQAVYQLLLRCLDKRP